MTGASRRRAAVRDALRNFDHALGRKADSEASRDDLADTLQGVSTTLDQLKPQVVLGRIGRADLESVVQNIETLDDGSRELKRLADAMPPAAPPGHIDASQASPSVEPGRDAR